MAVLKGLNYNKHTSGADREDTAYAAQRGTEQRQKQGTITLNIVLQLLNRCFLGYVILFDSHIPLIKKN